MYKNGKSKRHSYNVTSTHIRRQIDIYNKVKRNFNQEQSNNCFNNKRQALIATKFKKKNTRRLLEYAFLYSAYQTTFHKICVSVWLSLGAARPKMCMRNSNHLMCNFLH